MRNPIPMAAAAALLLLQAPACGDDDDTGTTAGEDGAGDACAGSGGEEVTIVDFAFDPAEVAVASGGVVAVTNDDSVTHTFTSDEAGFDCEVAGGGSAGVVIDAAAGTYAFQCDIHPTMTGTITVE